MSVPIGAQSARPTEVRVWWDGLRWAPPPGGPVDRSILDARMGSPCASRADGPLRRPVEWSEATDSDRRRNARDRRVILTSRERETFRRQEKAREKCCTSWVEYRRARDGNEELLLVPRRCGSRGCKACGSVSQAYHLARIVAEWRGFLTLTVPADRDPCDWWRQGNDPIERFVRWLRREVKEGRARTVQGPDGAREKLRFTWSVEAQEATMSPHWHMLHNVAYVNYTRARKAWQRIVGVRFAMIKNEKVTSKRGAINYVAKYCSKARLTPEILAIIGKGRQWSSAGCSPKEEAAGWREARTVEPDRAIDATEQGSPVSSGEGWRLAWSVKGGGAMWYRPLPDGWTAQVCSSLVAALALRSVVERGGIPGLVLAPGGIKPEVLRDGIV